MEDIISFDDIVIKNPTIFELCVYGLLRQIKSYLQIAYAKGYKI